MSDSDIAGCLQFTCMMIFLVLCPPLFVIFMFCCFPLTNMKRYKEVMNDPSKSMWCNVETNPALHIALSFLLTLLFWIPGVIHGFYVMFVVGVTVQGK